MFQKIRIWGIFIVGFQVLFFQSEAQAIIDINIEPIVGYEMTRQVLPTPHTSNRLIYGGRMIAGVLFLSTEAEYTHGSNQEVIGSITQTNTGDKLKVGLRSGFGIGSLFKFQLRAGVQASREKNEQTTAGITTTTYQPLTYKPYGGFGARAKLLGKLGISADVVAIIPTNLDFNQNEYQATAGFWIKLP